MAKYMKYTMYEKETKDSKYRNNPYIRYTIFINSISSKPPRAVAYRLRITLRVVFLCILNRIMAPLCLAVVS